MDEQQMESIGRQWLTSDPAGRAKLESQYPWIPAVVGRNAGKVPALELIGAMLQEIDTMIVEQQPHHRIHEKYWQMSRLVLGVLGRLSDG